MKKILIIEDDHVVANVYRNKLSVAGYQVEVAHDGQAGLEMARSLRPDAVLLDLMLPKMTGVEWMKIIRAEPDFQKMPVIVFSNTYLTGMVQEVWKLGATKCLSKANCTPQQVIDVIRGTLGDDETKNKKETPPPLVADPGKEAAGAGHELSASQHSDEEFQAELRKSFIDSLPSLLVGLRASLQGLIKTDNEMARLKQLHELYRRVHTITGNAATAGMVQIAKMADALEALLKELYEKPKNINASTLRTVAAAIDFMGILFEQGAFSETEMPAGNVLVVDDEVISRRAVVYALDKAKLKSVNLESPVAAYDLLLENKFDLIILDVDMPDMNGYELCAKLRELQAYKKTPVVFVTSLNDFENRASSTMSGGNDFIAKPFLFIELAVKALMYVLRVRLEQMKAALEQTAKEIKPA